MRKYKVFISYAREESNVKDNIISYLKPLSDNDRLEIWHDREMSVGDRFDDVIRNKLLESDIVIFLLSQSFLNSEYCRKVEEEIALQRYKDNENDFFRIIPIIASKCHYKNSELQHFNMPLDAKSIKEYDGEAYFDISKEIEGVLDVLDDSSSYKKHTIAPSVESVSTLNTTFQEFLNNLGFTIQKNGVENIQLLDLFVYPDLKRINNEIENTDVFVDSKNLINSGDFKNKLHIFLGDEQSGKTSLSKVLYIKALSNSLIPIYLKGEDIKKANEFEKLVEKSFVEQYKNSSFFRTPDIVIIIDGITDSPLNQKFMKNLISHEVSKYNSVIITSDTMLRMQDQIINEFKDYTIYELQSLGSKKKDELVDKWNILGRDESWCVNEMQSQHDYLVQSIESVMMRNIVPSKPIFVLMILQILETNSSNDFSLTSYGHCYHSLIIDALQRVNIRNDQHSDYFNYLSELAFYIYSKGVNKISGQDIPDFQRKYSENYLINSHDEFFNKILKSRIIVKDYNDNHKFQYKYLFYFFIAKSLAENENILEHVEDLCERIHSEKHANILIFVTHHTKQRAVIDAIIERVSNIFASQKAATLDSDELEFLSEFTSKIPEMVIDNRKDVEEERKKILEEKDEIEKESLLAEQFEGKENDDEDIELVNQELLDVNRSYRALEILGQIIRNRKGSLPKPLLNKLGHEAYTVGLRFLGYYLGVTQELKEEIVEEIHRLISTKRSWDDKRITQEARFYYWTFVYSMSLNVIRKTALSVGHKDLQGFYEEIANTIDTEVAKLIEIQIDIEFTKKIPKKKLETLWENLGDNIVTRRLLQDILVRHLHLNYVDHTDKNWISTNLDIPLLEQQRLQQKVKIPLLE
ncbi:toll/interleukin-1 receptor domain-containing protein [Vibrio splendidus]|uniref:toll/interleukin-1 receptor domain-containing protein n=1 Tax=Vibrio splendidus TaxID=29497 RepID=UPI002235C828|nr:toll/interleukin-1 receptor domain-containing protein [Vibrio splendidus]MCW4443587.1 toll/interleukin-1 receptor domain-containing protein [Vibrio splendidus]